MILKSYIVEQKIETLNNYRATLIYGENNGVKSDIKEKIKHENKESEIITFFESDILRSNLLYENVINQSLFSEKKIIFIQEASDKIFDKIKESLEEENIDIKIYLFSGNLEKKTKIRSYFEKGKEVAIFACYEDNERTLITYIHSELKGFKGVTGEIVNLNIIQEIVSKFDLKIEVGGGVRTINNIQKYADAGVEKVILGSAAIKNKNFLKEACKKFPDKIALGLDAKDGYLSVSGWKENSNQLTLDFLKEVNDYGASRLIYTDINRDGMKQSPNFEETSKVANVSNCPVIISGGVSSIEDIKKAKKLNKNIEGIIVGKAIYDGDIKLEELVREIDA